MLEEHGAGFEKLTSGGPAPGAVAEAGPWARPGGRRRGLTHA
ncbi:hypothetical protein BER2_0238 [plant metagenome]|uniref:Uncharacterized protein n=1 Tax=plant metagenome TaxID=1297885 RepID=A0A484R0S9_9ZZZZ